MTDQIPVRHAAEKELDDLQKEVGLLFGFKCAAAVFGFGLGLMIAFAVLRTL